MRRSRAPSPAGGADWRKLLVYSLLGWGLPTALTVTLLSLQLTLPVESPNHPAVGRKDCFLDDEGSIETYLLTIPMAILLSINVTIFILNILHLIRAKLETRNVRLSTRHNQSNGGHSSDIADQVVFNKDKNTRE